MRVGVNVFLHICKYVIFTFSGEGILWHFSLPNRFGFFESNKFKLSADFSLCSMQLSFFSVFQGFGAGNFKSLFEAIEADQADRGNL